MNTKATKLEARTAKHYFETLPNGRVKYLGTSLMPLTHTIRYYFTEYGTHNTISVIDGIMSLYHLSWSFFETDDNDYIFAENEQDHVFLLTSEGTVSQPICIYLGYLKRDVSMITGLRDLVREDKSSIVAIVRGCSDSYTKTDFFELYGTEAGTNQKPEIVADYTFEYDQESGVCTVYFRQSYCNFIVEALHEFNCTHVSAYDSYATFKLSPLYRHDELLKYFSETLPKEVHRKLQEV